MTYSEKLKDPRWQKKRLEVLERAKWKCSDCGDDKAPLHVHHCIYKKGKEPWEYETYHLMCLCEDCHEFRQGIERELKDQVAIYCRYHSPMRVLQLRWALEISDHFINFKELEFVKSKVPDYLIRSEDFEYPSGEEDQEE